MLLGKYFLRISRLSYACYMATVLTHFDFIILLLFGEAHTLQRPFYAIFSSLSLIYLSQIQIFFPTRSYTEVRDHLLVGLFGQRK